MRSDIGIVALPTEAWGPLWTTRHHVLRRLAQHFQVEWLDPPHEWRETLQVVRTRGLPGSPDADPGPLLVRTSELWLPRMYRPAWLADRTRALRMRRARAALVRRGCARIVAYAWHYDFLPDVRALPHECLVYHIVDEYSFSETEHPIGQAERDLIEMADRVIVHSPALMEKKGHLNPHTTMIPNGVDYHAFADPRPEPADLTAIPHPRVGYAGFIKQQLDWALMLELARAHPEWSWVFVGARQRHPEIEAVLESLARLSNVFFLGPKPATELARYPQHFDVAIMPYRATDYTKYIYPLKLHEYLASGTPAVATRIPSLDAFDRVVSLVDTPEGWSAALAAALDPAAHTASARAERQAVAKAHDWDILVDQIAAIIRDAV